MAEAQTVDRLQRARDLMAEVQQLSRDGRYQEAIPKAREALAIREALLEPTRPPVIQSVVALASNLRENGDYPEARSLYERALAAREQTLGPNHPAVAATLSGLGYLFYLTSDYTNARPLLERSLRIREQALGPSHADVADSLINLGLVLHAMGEYTAARPPLERALAIREATLGPNDPLLAPSAQSLGALLRETGDFAAARPLLERAVQIREQALGPTHPLVAVSLAQLAFLRQFSGDYAGARSLFERALKIREQALGPTHPAVAGSLGDLGEILQITGDYAGARALYERALKIREQAFGSSHPAVAASLAQFGFLSYLTGDYAAARPLYERALAMREATLGPNHRTVAGSLSEIAILLHVTGDYVGARQRYERAIRIWEQALGPDHPQLAPTLTNLGRLLWQSGDFTAARPVLERGLRIRERALGPRHPDIAQSLDSLGYLLQATGDHAGARALLDRGLKIREAALGPTHPSVAITLWSLALVQQRTGNYAEARQLFERSLQIREQVLGPNHPDVGWSLTALAHLNRTMGDYAAAQRLYERALPIARSAAIPEMTWRVTAGLAVSHERRGRPADALPLYRESVAALEGLAAQFGDETQRAQFLSIEGRLWPYDALARLLLRLHEKDQSLGYEREAWAVLETRKGRLVADALAAVGPTVGDPRARQEAAQVHSRQQQALTLERALREERAKAPAEQKADRIRALSSQLAQTKGEYLAQARVFLARYPQYRAQFVDQQTVDPKALAKFADRLPAGTLAVQYFAAPDALYLFVVAQGGHFKVKRQEVTQSDLYAVIREYRAQLDLASKEMLPWTDDGSAAYRQAVAPLKATTARLASHLLAPIEAELSANPNLILFPNDLLLYLPIHALTRKAPDGALRFLAETHVVSYVTQLELVDLLTPGKISSNAPVLAIANPDGTLPAASREVRELARIRPAVTALMGADATKAQFLKLVPGFPDIHLATHGILDAARPERSYLLMAGDDEASQRLTVADIAGLSLPPNALAILSACETALGEQVPGAALITLAAAFSQAGSQSIIASLWKVGDEPTRTLMVAFHRALPSLGRARALQQAELAVLRDSATAHPYYWAPFILIGAR